MTSTPSYPSREAISKAAAVDSGYADALDKATLILGLPFPPAAVLLIAPVSPAEVSGCAPGALRGTGVSGRASRWVLRGEIGPWERSKCWPARIAAYGAGGICCGLRRAQRLLPPVEVAGSLDASGMFVRNRPAGGPLVTKIRRRTTPSSPKTG